MHSHFYYTQFNKVLIACLFILAAHARVQAQDTIYFTSDWKPCADYQASFFRVKMAGTPVKVWDYYLPSKNLQMSGTFADQACKIRDGKFVYYEVTGEKSYELFYTNNIRNGKSLQFHKNGKLKDETIYINDKIEGVSTEYDSNGVLVVQANYANNHLHGDRITYYPNGKLRRVETFDSTKNDPIVKKCFTLSGADTTYYPRETMPEFTGGIDQLYFFLSRNIKYPPRAREKGLEGKVVMQFVITNTGELTEVEVIRSPSEEFTKESVRVVKSMPNWKPGTLEGQPVSVKYTLPIRFQLN